jgi:hypothetical protein
MQQQQKTETWRELLETILSSPAERARIADEIGVRSITLMRWVQSQSVPRPQNLLQLLSAVPEQYRDRLRRLIELEFPSLSVEKYDDSPSELPYSFVEEVLAARANTVDSLRAWTIIRLVLQHALRQLDPTRLGMAISIVRCMPPKEGKVRSVRENLGLGTAPWESDLEPKMLFLGAESLAGFVISTGRPAVIQRLAEQTWLPAVQFDYEVSAAAHPLQLGSRIAGCLLVSSTQADFFTSSRVNLIKGYAYLTALAFEPTEFYPQESIQLQVLPDLNIQRSYLASFQQRVRRHLQAAFEAKQLLNALEAETLAWQELEEDLLHYQSEL